MIVTRARYLRSWKSQMKRMLTIVSTTYGAIQQMMKFYCDMNPEINLEIINLTFPCSHDTIIKQTEEALAKWNEVNPTEGDEGDNPKGTGDGRVRLVVVDSIASNPGYVPLPPLILFRFPRILYSGIAIVRLSCLRDIADYQCDTALAESCRGVSEIRSLESGGRSPLDRTT